MDRARPTSARLEYACHRISTRSSSARRQRVSARWWTPNRRILTVSTDTQSFFFSAFDTFYCSDDNDSQSLHLLEAEALGATPQSPTDPTLAKYWNVPVRYVYDAAAERTKEWLQHEHEHEHDAAAK